MNHRIIILITLLFIIVYSLRLKKNKGFSKEDTLNLKGLFCLLVIIGHLAAWTSKETIFSFSSNFGFLAVAGFLFISGYGLTKNSNKSNILSLIKKLLIILIPFILINAIFYLLFNLLGDKITIIDTLKSLVNFHPIAYFSWYVIEIVILYILFFITNKIFKKPILIAIAMLIEITVYNLLTYHFGLANSWYLSNYAFVLGIVIAYNFKTIDKIITKHYKLVFSTTLVLFLLTLNYQFILKERFVPRFNMFIDQFCVTLFPLLIYLFLQKFELESKAFKTIGKYSYEIYLVQGIPLLLLRSKFININNDFIYTISCIFMSIIIGILLYYIDSIIYKITKLKQKKVKI